MSRKTVAMSLAAAFISAPAAGLVPPESLTCQLFPPADINADKGPWNKGDPTAVATLILGKKHWELKEGWGQVLGTLSSRSGMTRTPCNTHSIVRSVRTRVTC